MTDPVSIADLADQEAITKLRRPRLGDWRPIETAPTDMPVLTYRKARLQSVAVYLPKANDWQGGWICADGIGLLDVTHWMPLPPPPEAAA